MTATLKEQFITARKAARDYIKEIEGGDITEAQLAHAKSLTETATALSDKVERQEALKGFDGIITEPNHERGSGPISGRESAHRSAKGWAGDVATNLREKAGTHGSKSVIGGTISVPTVIVPPVPLEARPTSLLQLFARGTLSASSGLTGANSFSFFRQTTRDHNVATVPDGALKPTSSYDWDEVEDRVRVLAHLSQVLPERFLDDYTALEGLLTSEMYAGLLEALEWQTINGDGAKVDQVRDAAGAVTTQGSDNLRGILNTSGIKTVAAVTGDILTTLSNGLYSQTIQGDKPTAWVMNPADVQRLLLLRENGTTGALMFGSGRSALESFIGDAPIVESTQVPARTAIVGDFDKALLVTRQDATLKAFQSGEMVETNQIRFRLEGRYGFALTRPSAFTKVTLPA